MGVGIVVGGLRFALTTGQSTTLALFEKVRLVQ